MNEDSVILYVNYDDKGRCTFERKRKDT